MTRLRTPTCTNTFWPKNRNEGLPDALATELVGKATPPEGAPLVRRLAATPAKYQRDRPVAGPDGVRSAGAIASGPLLHRAGHDPNVANSLIDVTITGLPGNHHAGDEEGSLYGGKPLMALSSRKTLD